jgi:hypothetical protein
MDGAIRHTQLLGCRNVHGSNGDFLPFSHFLVSASRKLYRLWDFRSVLVLLHVFDEQLCQKLIGLYVADGGTAGVVRRGRGVIDASFKRGKVYVLVD